MRAVGDHREAGEQRRDAGRAQLGEHAGGEDRGGEAKERRGALDEPARYRAAEREQHGHREARASRAGAPSRPRERERAEEREEARERALQQRAKLGRAERALPQEAHVKVERAWICGRRAQVRELGQQQLEHVAVVVDSAAQCLSRELRSHDEQGERTERVQRDVRAAAASVVRDPARPDERPRRQHRQRQRELLRPQHGNEQRQRAREQRHEPRAPRREGVFAAAQEPREDRRALDQQHEQRGVPERRGRDERERRQREVARRARAGRAQREPQVRGEPREGEILANQYEAERAEVAGHGCPQERRGSRPLDAPRQLPRRAEDAEHDERRPQAHDPHGEAMQRQRTAEGIPAPRHHELLAQRLDRGEVRGLGPLDARVRPQVGRGEPVGVRDALRDVVEEGRVRAQQRRRSAGAEARVAQGEMDAHEARPREREHQRERAYEPETARGAAGAHLRGSSSAIACRVPGSNGRSFGSRLHSFTGR